MHDTRLSMRMREWEHQIVIPLYGHQLALCRGEL
jgi:hypothetical protein